MYFYLPVHPQAVATAGEGDPAGRGRHGRQAAHHGGPQVQHPQVGAGGLRPGHDPPESGQPQPGIRRLQLPVGGATARCAFRLEAGSLREGGCRGNSTWSGNQNH